jgi:dolichol-phosphate mannosyltransferase
MTTSAIECGSISFPLASVIVPVYNEGQAVAANISRLYDHIASIEPLTTWELIIVDDGSVDDTLLRVERFAKGYDNVRVVRHERNRGVGAAMKSGIDKARGSCVVVVDSDLSYDPRTVTRLIAEQRRSRAALVLASPYMAGGGTRNVPIIRLYMSLWANRLLSLANGGRIKTFTGMVRAYDRAFLSTLAWPE